MASEPQAQPRQDSQGEVLVHDDNTDTDRDSVLESVLGSTASINSSILKSRQEYGRTYHRYKEGKYSFPNDEAESERLDLQYHTLILSFNGKLGLCPLMDKDAKVNRVLDAGCGTGIWSIDYADEHPEATKITGMQIIGVDLSPIQPNFVPPNVEFQIDDLEEPWNFGAKFDLIHSSMMTAAIADWDTYMQQCYDNLEPGGYLEMTDIMLPYESDDGTLLESHAHHKWSLLLCEGSEKMGRPFQDVKTYKPKMEKIGFTDVVMVKNKWPLNPWAKDKKYKEIGLWSCENITSGAAAFSYILLIHGLGWTKEAIDVFLVDVRKGIKDKSIHAYLPVYTVYGRKPETSS